MYEYDVVNNETGEEDIIFGYSFTDACKRNNYNPQEWEKRTENYID